MLHRVASVDVTRLPNVHCIRKYISIADIAMYMRVLDNDHDFHTSNEFYGCVREFSIAYTRVCGLIQH